MILAHKIHVLTKKEELDTVRLPGKAAVVLDVLFATTTMAAALAGGATTVIPALDREHAESLAQQQVSGSYVLAGELNTVTLPGFAPPTPLALLAHGVAGKTLVYATTNGTVALRACEGATAVYAGALVNARAVVREILARHAERTLLLVCAGSANNFNLEDFFGAGCYVELLAQALGEQADLSDAARAARALFRAGDPLSILMESRVGRMMRERGLVEEVRYAAQLSVLDVAPLYADGALAAVPPGARASTGVAI